MIHGIGVDICNIKRMENAVARNGFIERVFSDEEIEYSNRDSMSAQHFASSFAAKEAFSKATGWGLWKTGLKSCSVKRTSNGPVFVFNDDIRQKLSEAGIKNVFLSISHDSGVAIAMVILER